MSVRPKPAPDGDGTRLPLAMLRIALALIAIVMLAATSLAQDAGSAGKLIDVQASFGAPEGARAYRILYWSTGLDGKPVEVSGVVIAPRGPPPPGGRPVVAWAHPTTGVVSRCAPSLARVVFASIQGLRDMLDRGYVVAATDYPGLGTPEVHPYLVGTSEARSVLELGPGGKGDSRCRRRSAFRGLGPFAGRAGGAVHRH